VREMRIKFVGPVLALAMVAFATAAALPEPVVAQSRGTVASAADVNSFRSNRSFWLQTRSLLNLQRW